MGSGLSRCLTRNGNGDGDFPSSCCFNSSDERETKQKNSSPSSYRPPSNGLVSADATIHPVMSKELFLSVFYGKKKTLQSILYDAGKFDVSSVVWIKGLNALHVAAMRGHLSCVKLLCTFSKFDLDQLDELDRTALTWSARNKHFAIYEYLRTKTLLSRLPDLHGLMASQYLYDSTVDAAGPDFAAFDKLFQPSPHASSKWENMHEEDCLSLQSVSLGTSPASSSNKSTPQDRPSRRTTSPQMKCNGSQGFLQPTSLRSPVDVSITASPDLSPCGGHVTSAPRRPHLLEQTLSTGSAATALTLKTHHLNDCRRYGLHLASPTVIITADSDDSDSLNDSTTAATSPALESEYLSLCDTQLKQLQHQHRKASRPWLQGIKKVFSSLSSQSVSPGSTRESRSGEGLSGGLREPLVSTQSP